MHTFEMYKILFLQPTPSLSWWSMSSQSLMWRYSSAEGFARIHLKSSLAANAKEGAQMKIQVCISLCTTPKHWGLSTPFAVMSRKETVGETKIRRLQTNRTFMCHCQDVRMPVGDTRLQANHEWHMALLQSFSVSYLTGSFQSHYIHNWVTFFYLHHCSSHGA